MKQAYVHYGVTASEFRTDKVDPVSGGSAPGFKPIGGFWATPIGAEGGYREFAHSSGERYCDPGNAVGFYLNDKARVLTLNTDESVRDFFIDYGVVWNATPYKEYIDGSAGKTPRPIEMDLSVLSVDYEAVAKDYDAVRLDLADASDLAVRAFADSWGGDSIVVLHPEVIEPITDRATRNLLKPKTEEEMQADESFKRAFSIAEKAEEIIDAPYTKDDVFAAINDGNYEEARFIMDVLENKDPYENSHEEKLTGETLEQKYRELQSALGEMEQESHRFYKLVERERATIAEKKSKRNSYTLIDKVLDKWKIENAKPANAAITAGFVAVIRLATAAYNWIADKVSGEKDLLKKTNTVKRDIAHIEALMKDAIRKVETSPDKAVKCMNSLLLQVKMTTAKIRSIYEECAERSFETEAEIAEHEETLRRLSGDCADTLKKAAEKTIEQEEIKQLPEPPAVPLPTFEERINKAKEKASDRAGRHGWDCFIDRHAR